VRDAVKLTLPEGVPFPGVALERSAVASTHEEAPAGMVEAAAEHAVNPQVDVEHQEQLLREQQGRCRRRSYSGSW
jgi:large subunit ribosomal protein L3